MAVDTTPLPAAFYDRTPLRLGRALLGRLLVREHERGRVQIGRIVETEAYLGPHDLAAHSAKGRTPRTEVLFGPAGRAYVFLIYGMYHCFNVTTGRGGAVLFRSVEPLLGVHQRCDGPGRLATVLWIDRAMNGLRLDAKPLWIAAGEPVPACDVVRGPRIGVAYAGAWAHKPFRFRLRSRLVRGSLPPRRSR